MFPKQRDLVFHLKHACDQKRKIRSVKSVAAFLYGTNLDCNQCGKTFKRRKDLNYHVRHLCGIRGIQCPYCNKCYTYTSNVKYHISRYHEGKEVYYNKLFWAIDCREYQLPRYIDFKSVFPKSYLIRAIPHFVLSYISPRFVSSCPVPSRLVSSRFVSPRRVVTMPFLNVFSETNTLSLCPNRTWHKIGAVILLSLVVRAFVSKLNDIVGDNCKGSRNHHV